MNLLESLTDNIVIDKDKCTFCGICVERCVLDNLRMKLAPCRQACPLGVNCHGYVQLIARGEEAGAMELLLEALPFPGILGRICSQPCEESCYHKTMDGEAVAVRALKRYLADKVSVGERPLPEVAKETGRKVAIVGSGPAGLMAAYHLRIRGHSVEIFESENEPGGMLRWAIPEFRLPQNIVEEEISLLKKLGVQFSCGVFIGKDKTLEDLKEAYQAVIIATGCPQHTGLNIKGEALPGVYHGLPFLNGIRKGKNPETGGKVIVIGGGNVAVDAAQTALRLGAEDVSMVCLESAGEIPAFSWTLKGALSEGIELFDGWGPVQFTSEKGVLKGIEFQRCLGVFDRKGDFNPQFDPNDRMSLEADMAIVAIGQHPDLGWLEKFGLAKGTKLEVDPLILQTSDEKIFLAGDLVKGPSSVIEAMAGGKESAESAHRYVSGQPISYGRAYEGPVETDFEIDTSKGADFQRIEIREQHFQGKGDFLEVEQPLDVASARQEAGRCYSCGQPFGKYRTCWFCLPCEVDCPHEALWVEIPYLLR